MWCEKVDPHMSPISVMDRSTKISCLQFSQAIGSGKLMSCSMPDVARLQFSWQAQHSVTLDAQISWQVHLKRRFRGKRSTW